MHIEILELGNKIANPPVTDGDVRREAFQTGMGRGARTINIESGCGTVTSTVFRNWNSPNPHDLITGWTG